MESAGIFIWRVRLCVLLAVAGQSFVHFDKHDNNMQPELVAQNSAQHVKCAVEPGSGGAVAARNERPKLDCSHVASRSASLKTSDHQVVLPPDAASMKATHWSMR
jgi:hypothetical protein